MPMSIDVNLPRDIEPRWPDRCVCCGRPGPDGRVRVWTHSIGWWTLVSWNFGALYSVKVPACASCGKRLWATHIARWVLAGFIAFVGVAVAMWVLASYRGPLRKWLAMLIALVCCLPFLLWEALFPPPFDITCFKNTVDYEFRDPAYAAEFESLNRVASADAPA